MRCATAANRSAAALMRSLRASTLAGETGAEREILRARSWSGVISLLGASSPQRSSVPSGETGVERERCRCSGTIRPKVSALGGNIAEAGSSRRISRNQWPTSRVI